MAILGELVGRRHAEAFAARGDIPRIAAEEAGVAASATGGWRSTVLGSAVSLTLLAGSGSRWQASLEAARRAGTLSGAAASFDPALPRGLFPVRDFLRSGAAAQGGIPIAAYSFAAVAGLGAHVVVVRGHEEEIRRGIFAPLGFEGPEGTWRFATQEAPFGKPLGHGDAAWQCRALWREAEWVVTNFGGDANSRHSVEASVLAMAALDFLSEGGAFAGCDLLIPAALLPAPAYPIGLDAEGRPVAFGHDKLGLAKGGTGGGEAYSNVGLRVYRASALAAALEELRDKWWVPGKGYAIPGNDPAGGECALDNADAVFASRGRARILALAHPRELSPAKSLDEIPRFEAAVSEVVIEDGLRSGFQERSGAQRKGEGIAIS